MAEMNVRWQVANSVGILLLDNPPGNYLADPEFVSPEKLGEWLCHDIKGMVVAGAGSHFSAGADLRKLLKQTEDIRSLEKSLFQGNALVNFIADLDIPVVAAISGVCFGGGLEIALACTIRICTQRSLFAFPEINQSLIPVLGGVKRLQSLCGESAAAELLLSGDTLNAHKAYDLKIVDRIVEGKDSTRIAADFLNSLVDNRPKKVIQMMMRSLRNSSRKDFEDAQKEDVGMFCELALDVFQAEQNHLLQ